MQWTDVIRPPSERHLRQFAALFLIVLLGFAAWRWAGGRADAWAIAFATLGVVVGGLGLVAPRVMRPIWTGWMVVAFPIGWTVSRIALGSVFFGVVTPMALCFRAAGRDALRLRRGASETYWLAKRKPASVREYFRQS